MKKSIFCIVFLLVTFSLMAIRLPNGVNAKLLDASKIDGKMIEAVLANEMSMTTPIGNYVVNGKLTFYENGNLESFNLVTEQQVSTSKGMISAVGLVRLNQNGTIAELETKHPVGIATSAGTFSSNWNRIGFYDNGNLKRIFFTQNQNATLSYGGFEIKDYIEFHQNGNVKQIILAKNREIETHDNFFTVTGPLSFHENGYIKRISLAESSVIETNYDLLTVNYVIEFYADGRIKLATLNKNTSIDNVYYHQGETVHFTQSGTVSHLKDNYNDMVTVIPFGQTRIIRGKEVQDEKKPWLSGAFIEKRIVKLSPYSIMKTEVPYELWERVYNWAISPDRNERRYHFVNKGQPGGMEKGSYLQPVTNIAWGDAIAWCNAYSEMTGKSPCYLTQNGEIIRNAINNQTSKARLDISRDGYRLPTEAEWEFAARGGNEDDILNWNYKYAGSDNLSDIGWWNINSNEQTHVIGKRIPNSLDLFDMSGNICEWCEDWDNTIKKEIVTNPVGAVTGDTKVIRGSYFASPDFGCEVKFRNINYPNIPRNYIGFRLAQTVLN